MNAPLNLDAMLDFERICKVFSITPGADKPMSCKCVVCRQGTMYIYVNAQHHRWWACDKCGIAGPTLLIYQKVRKHKHIRPAWISLIGEADSGAADSMLTNSAIQMAAMEEERQQALTNFWEHSKQHLMTGVWPASGILSKFRVSVRDADMQNFVGAFDRAELEELQGITDTKLLRKNMNNAVMLKYENLPGKISSLYCIHEKKDAAIEIDSDDAGFLGLSQMLRSQDSSVCFVVSDPIMYLHMQQRWLVSKQKPMSAVCFNKMSPNRMWMKTTKNWDVLHQRRVIFWDEDTDSVLRYARNLGERGMVALHPYPTKTLMEQYSNIFHLVSTWKQSAITWLEYVKRELLNRSSTETDTFLQALGKPLTEEERNRLHQMCTDDQWYRIHACFGNPGGTKTFTFRGDVIYERGGLGWYRVNTNKKLPHDLMIANAYMILHQACVIDGDTIYSGEAIFNDARFPFTEKASVLRKDPADWLTQFFIQRQCGVPQFDPQYRKVLVDMAIASSVPKTVTQLSRVGWDSVSKAFFLPKFSVSTAAGITLYDDTKIVLPNTPAAKVYPTAEIRPRKTTMIPWFEPNVLNEGTLALLACVIANLTSTPAGQLKCGIAVWERHGVAEQIIARIGDALGLLSIKKPDRPSQWELEDITKTECRHDFPAVLLANRPTGNSWQPWIQQVTPHNVILSCTGIEVASRLNLNSNWFIVRADDLNQPNESSPPAYDLIVSLYLQYIAQRGFRPFSVPSVPRQWPIQVLDGIYDMLFGDTPGGKGSNPDLKQFWCRVEDRIITWGHGQLWKKLMAAIAIETRKEHFRIDPAQGRHSVCWQDESLGRVYVHRDKLYSMLTRFGWFLPREELLDVSISSSDLDPQVISNGWSFNTEQWNLQIEQWNTQFMPTAGFM